MTPLFGGNKGGSEEQRAQRSAAEREAARLDRERRRAEREGRPLPEEPVELFDERFTTKIAAKSGDKRTAEDSRAAAVLLEDWLLLHSGEFA